MRFTEPLNNGLVTSRAPTMLREGELQRADNTYYQPNDPGLHVAPEGVVAATFSTSEYITGLVSCAFDFVLATCDITRSSTAVVVAPIVINTVAIASGSAIIIAPTGNNFVTILKGATATGSNIPASTTVLSVDSPTQITLSAAATATGTTNITFTNAKFSNVSAGASVAGKGIPNGTTVASVGADGTTLVLSTAASITETSKLTIKADSLLVAQVVQGTTATYQKAKLGADGTVLTFVPIESGVAIGTSLDQIHYNNEHVLLNGTHPNRVLTADGLTRPHGLAPVTGSCTPVITPGIWALKDGVGFYSYWTTEYDAVNDIESDFNLGVDSQNKPIKPPLVQITAVATQAVKVSRPPRINLTATHWRVYRSVKYNSTTAKSAAKENQYPNGWLISQIELRDDGLQQEFIDGGGLGTTTAATAGNATTGVGIVGVTWAAITQATGAANNAGATDDTKSATLTYAGARGDAIPLTLTNFAIPTVSEPITGIQITVTGRKVTGGILLLEVRKNTGTLPQIVGRKVVPFTTSNSAVILGSGSDLWGQTWSPSDFSDGRFTIRCYGTVLATGDKVTVDAVSVVVSHGETQDQVTGAFLSNITDPYPAVTVSPYGFTISAGRGGLPPKATTGDIFQDSLLLNDVEDSSIARYSFPSRIDLFPAPYFLNFDTREQDEITLIRTVGNVAIVGLKHQIYRINYLPRDTDSEFERGRAVEVVENAHGIAGRNAACSFTLPGFGPALAYINNYGIFLTDGYRVRPLTSDLDWWGTVDVDKLAEAKLVNNTELQLIELLYPPADFGGIQSKLFFHYHPSHLKGDPRAPELKVTGPKSFGLLESLSITTAGLPNGTRKVYRGTGTQGGTVGSVVEYFSRLESSIGAVTIKTRAIPAAQLGNEWRINEIALGYTLRDYRPTADGATFALAATITKTNAEDRTSITKSITVPTFANAGLTNPKSRRISKTVIPESGQAMAIQIDPTPPTFRCSFDFITIDAEGQGVENPT